MRQDGAHLLSGCLCSEAVFRKINHCSWGPLVSGLVLVNAALGEELKKRPYKRQVPARVLGVKKEFILH